MTSQSRVRSPRAGRRHGSIRRHGFDPTGVLTIVLVALGTIGFWVGVVLVIVGVVKCHPKMRSAGIIVGVIGIVPDDRRRGADDELWADPPH